MSVFSALLPKRAAVALATIGVAVLVSIAIAAPSASAQLPTNPTPEQQQAMDALRSGGVPSCIAYSAGLDCTGYNRDNVWVDLFVHTDQTSPDPTLATLYVFNPYDGRSTDVWLLEQEDGSVWVVGTDSDLGTIDFNSGWVSNMYPTGNPFDAAVRAPVGIVGGWGGGSGSGPCDIRHPCFDPGPS